MKHIYTDGSCIKNPNGPGGWSWLIIEKDDFILIDSGRDTSTTNNRMELKAIIEAVKFIENREEIYTIFSDSLLTINCASGKWKRKANLDLWKEYDTVSNGKNITFEWVKAHNGDKYNEMVDKIAFSEAKRIV